MGRHLQKRQHLPLKQPKALDAQAYQIMVDGMRFDGLTFLLCTPEVMENIGNSVTKEAISGNTQAADWTSVVPHFAMPKHVKFFLIWSRLPPA